MGLFGKKKERNIVSISGERLIGLLQKAVLLTEEEVNDGRYIAGPEIMFEYRADVHFIGIRYDKKTAKEECCVGFNEAYLSVYVDKQFYPSVEELRDNAEIKGVLLKDIADETGIVVTPEFLELL